VPALPLSPFPAHIHSDPVPCSAPHPSLPYTPAPRQVLLPRCLPATPTELQIQTPLQEKARFVRFSARLDEVITWNLKAEESSYFLGLNGFRCSIVMAQNCQSHGGGARGLGVQVWGCQPVALVCVFLQPVYLHRTMHHRPLAL
jgi:hypothetical protein